MNISKILFSVFTLLISCGLQAQPIDNSTFEKNLETAEEQMAKHEYYNAREYYNKAFEQQRQPEIALKIADLNYLLKDYRRASIWYRRVLRRDRNDTYLDSRFDYARVMKMRGEYEDAMEEFNYFLERSDNEELKEKARTEIIGMQLASAMEEDVSISVENTGRPINGRFLEASPYLDRDGKMFFSTIRSDEVIVLDDKAEGYYSQIYMAVPEENERRRADWQDPVALGENVNRPEFHTTNVSLSPDGSRMYFTRTILDGHEIVESKAYLSERTGSGWGAAQELEGVNGEYIVRHPVVGELYGNEVLFFSSNMEGGKGGYDLYYSTYEGGSTYSLPTNLGEEINTIGDEITPFYRDGILYFSSDGLPTIGGYDIYSSTWDGSSWSEPENMGLAYNSTCDDIYYTLNVEGSKGFLVSNRPGTTTRSVGSKTCCDDIWTVKKRDIIIDVIATVIDDEGNELMESEGEMYDLSSGGKQIAEENSGETNQMTFQLDPDNAYRIVVKKDGYYPAEAEINTVGKVDDYTYNKEFVLRKKEPDVVIVTINEPIRLNRIYYDFDDDKILPEAEKDLTDLLGYLREYPEMVIELSSHTDSRGSDLYNQQLSERRAQSAKNWLVERGIDPERIEAVGYGEEQILNECENGVQCSELEHQYNRRTEFKIIAGPTSIEIKKKVQPESNRKK
ncbi:MAG: OmpA family protein [Saprospiraceae bacterium]|nr:OmpA family protein [Saprospiraceae bacterium]